MLILVRYFKMASHFSLSKELETTMERTNHARLCRLLVEGGTKALREVFDQIHPPSQLANRLIHFRRTMQPLKSRKVINNRQWDQLYNASPVSSTNFDITLLMVLLRNICNFHSPKTGWDKQPNASDCSLEADFVRIKVYRNQLCHSERASVSNNDFASWWSEIGDALVRMGAKQDDVDNLLTDTMDSEMEQKYREDLEQWAEAHEEVKTEVKQLTKKVDKVMEKLTSEKQCSRHNDPVRFYCKTCHELICMTCTYVTHKSPEHVHCEMNKAGDQIRKDMFASMVHLQKKDKELETNEKQAYNMLTSLTIQFTQQRERIKQHSRLHIRNQDKKQQEDDLISNLTDKYMKLMSEINQDIRRLTDTKESIIRTLLQLDDVQTIKDDSEFLSMCKEIDKIVTKNLNIDTGFYKNYDTLTELIPCFLQNKLGMLLFPPLPSLSSVKCLDTSSGGHIKTGEQLCFVIKCFNCQGDSFEANSVCSLAAFISHTDGPDINLNVVQDDPEDEVKNQSLVFFDTERQGKHELLVTLRAHHIVGSPLIFAVRPSWRKSRISIRQYKRPEDLTTASLIARDKNSNIVVSDYENGVVEIFDKFVVLKRIFSVADLGLFNPETIAISPENVYIIVNQNPKHPIVLCTETGQFIRSCGQRHVIIPTGVALNHSSDILYVGDRDTHSIHMLNYQTGECLKDIGQHGKGDREFKWPTFLTINHKDQVIVSDYGNHRIQVLSKEGDFLFTFGKRGSNNNEFNGPNQVITDMEDNMYVCDCHNQRVQKFDSKGNFLYTFIDERDGIGLCYSMIISHESPCKVFITNREDRHHLMCFEEVTSQMKSSLMISE